MRILEGVLIVGFIALIGAAMYMAASYTVTLRYTRDDQEPPTCWEQALTISHGKYEGIVCGYRVYPIKGVKNGFNVRPVKGMTWK